MVGDPKSILGHFGPTLTNRPCGNTKPNSILRQGNMVWVQFMSDKNSTVVNNARDSKLPFEQVCSKIKCVKFVFRNVTQKFFYIFLRQKI